MAILVDAELVGIDEVIGAVRPTMPVGYLVEDNNPELRATGVTPLTSPADDLP